MHTLTHNLKNVYFSMWQRKLSLDLKFSRDQSKIQLVIFIFTLENVQLRVENVYSISHYAIDHNNILLLSMVLSIVYPSSLYIKNK